MTNVTGVHKIILRLPLLLPSMHPKSMPAQELESGNIDDVGKQRRRRVGIFMLVVAAAVYIGLIIPPNIDRRFLIVSAAPCVVGVFCLMQSYQVISPTHFH